jgi:hypothetical protein
MRPLKLRIIAPRAALLLAVALLSASPCSGMTWRWSNPTPHGNDVYGMAWNGYLSVQVCDDGQVYTGTDFLGWTPRNSGTTNDLEAVTFFGNRIVIVGAYGTVGYSDDGVNFTTTNLNTANWLVGVAASSNLVVAVGDTAVIYTSTDGANWHYQGQAPGYNGADWLLSVAWGAGVFVATGEGGYVATSPNGTNWTSRTSGTSDDLTCVSYVSNAPGAFPATAFYAVSYEGQAFYSTNNGNAWKMVPIASNTNMFWTVAANDTTGLVAGDSDAYLGTGMAAGDWRKQSDPALVVTEGVPVPAWNYYAAMWDSTNSLYRVAGDDGMMVDGTPTNGVYAWPMQYDSSRNLLWEVTLAGGLYVAVGEHAGIMTSDNGGDWSIEYVPQTNSVSISNTVFFCVGGTTNLLIAAGTSGSLAVSPNLLATVMLTNADGSLSTNQVGTMGIFWYSLPAPTTNDLAGLCVFSNNFFLSGSSATLLRSADGTNWTSVPVPVTADLAGLAASTNLMVVVGDSGTILTSPDGNNWTSRASGTTSGLLRVRYLNGAFLAVGENGAILRSTNGTSWSAATSGTTNWLNDAVMVTNTCYVVGNNGTVLASTNFADWTNVGCITYQSLYGAATQNGQLVAVGLEGTILRSQIVPNLATPIFFYYYAQSSGQNVFAVSGYPDQCFTLDSSPDLINWTTGPLLDLLYGSGTLTFITSLPANPPSPLFYRANLSINAGPSITTPPASQTVLAGRNATFTVVAAGTTPLSYQWRFNATNNLAGATTASLTLTNVQSTNAGSYAVVVTNAYGSVTSAVAALTVNVAPSITTPPTNQTVLAGQNATFTVVAVGTAPLSYQWRFNTTNNLAGATNASLTLTNAQSTNAGSYTVVVTNAYGSVTSAAATLAVASPPTLNIQFSGTNAMITWPASGVPGFTLETTTNLLSPTWVSVGTAVVIGNQYVVTNALAPHAQFFRLKK